MCVNVSLALYVLTLLLIILFNFQNLISLSQKFTNSWNVFRLYFLSIRFLKFRVFLKRSWFLKFFVFCYYFFNLRTFLMIFFYYNEIFDLNFSMILNIEIVIVTIFVRKLIKSFTYFFNSFTIRISNWKTIKFFNLTKNNFLLMFFRLRVTCDFINEIFLSITMQMHSWFKSKFKSRLILHWINVWVVFFVTKIKFMIVVSLFCLNLNVEKLDLIKN